MDKKAEYTASTLRICIDEMKRSDYNITGSICGIAVEKEIPFCGSSEFLVWIDRLLDRIGRPQPSRKSRSFRENQGEITSYQQKPKLYHSPEEIVEKKGKLKTCDATFVSRLRSSWQGFVKDDEGRLIGHFESDLEFIALLYDRGVTS